LVGTAIIKISVALNRGRTNIGFLILMVVALVIAAGVVSRPRRTRSGDLLLEDMRTLFSGLSGRANTLSPGGASNEVAFLAALFGVQALPLAAFPFARQLGKRAQPSASSCSTFISSCGSSSCGSSCGGGCGGGCGGCGS
jgi:hypothetical protein